MSGTISVDCEDLIDLFKTASLTASTDKKDPIHYGVLLTVRSGDSGNVLVGVGYNPGVLAGCYTIPSSGALTSDWVLPMAQLSTVTGFLGDAVARDEHDVKVTFSANGITKFATDSTSLITHFFPADDYELVDAIDAINGDAAKDTVLSMTSEANLPTGALLNFGKKNIAIVSKIAAKLGEISIIPTGHHASWVLLESFQDPSWCGAVLASTYPEDAYVNERNINTPFEG